MLFLFLQALSSLMIMFVIQWVYAVANIVVALLLFFYIGKASPGLPTGECFISHYNRGGLGHGGLWCKNLCYIA